MKIASRFAIVLCVVNTSFFLLGDHLVLLAQIPLCQRQIPKSDCFSGQACRFVAWVDCPKKGSCAGIVGSYGPTPRPKNSCASGDTSYDYCNVLEDLALCYTTYKCAREAGLPDCVPNMRVACSEIKVYVALGGSYASCTWGGGG